MPHQQNCIPFDIQPSVVVVAFLRRGDAVAEEGQRQVKLSRATSRQRRVVAAEFKRDHLLSSVGCWSHQFRPVGLLRPEFCFERHLKRLPARPGMVRRPRSHRFGRRCREAQLGKLLGHPGRRFVDSRRTGAAALHCFGCQQPHALLQPRLRVARFPAGFRKTSGHQQHGPHGHHAQTGPFTKHHDRPPWLQRPLTK